MIEGLGRGAGMLFSIDAAHLAGYVLADVLVAADLRGAQRELAIAEEQRRLRNELLENLGAGEVFPAGSVLLTEEGGKPDPRPTFVAVTPEELVLLDADVQRGPERIWGRIPVAGIAGLRLLDGDGEPLDPSTTDEIAEIDRRDRFVALWIDVGSPEGATSSHAFVFRAASLALEAKRDFERVLAPAAD